MATPPTRTMALADFATAFDASSFSFGSPPPTVNLTPQQAAPVGGMAEDEWAISGIDLKTIALAREIEKRRPAVRKKFKALASAWRKERDPSSNLSSEWAMCPSYQRIIAMGPDVIPLILEELRGRFDHWFWALHFLADENPVHPDHAGDLRAAANDWIEWGKRNAFI